MDVAPMSKYRSTDTGEEATFELPLTSQTRPAGIVIRGVPPPELTFVELNVQTLDGDPSKGRISTTPADIRASVRFEVNNRASHDRTGSEKAKNNVPAPVLAVVVVAANINAGATLSFEVMHLFPVVTNDPPAVRLPDTPAS